MKIITLLYLFLFICHLILGPYFYRDLLHLKKPTRMAGSLKDIFKRTLWITYVSFLFMALFNEYPNAETFIIAFLFSVTSTVGFWLKFKNDKTLIIGLIDHFIFLFIPVVCLFFYYKIDLLNYQPTYLTLFGVLILLSYKYLDSLLYLKGTDI